MKRIYILLCVIFLFHEDKAQHTITAAFNPVVGDIDSRTALDTTGLFLGSSGTSQTWNYTGISTGLNGTGSGTFVAMSAVPNNSLYPSGTIAQQIGLSGNYPVFINTSSKIEYLGLAQTTASNCNFFSDPKTYYSLPFSYGSLSIDTYSSTTWTGTVNTIADGTGVLQLPSGTYSNVLKLTFSTFDTDGSMNVSVVENQYFSAISKFPLLVVFSYTLSSPSSTNTTIGKGGHLNAFVSTSTKKALNEKAFSVFPNPVTNEELFVKPENNNPISRMEIINILGQKAMSIQLHQTSGNEIERINVTSLKAGIYYLAISTAEGTSTKKIIIE